MQITSLVLGQSAYSAVGWWRAWKPRLNTLLNHPWSDAQSQWWNWVLAKCQGFPLSLKQNFTDPHFANSHTPKFAHGKTAGALLPNRESGSSGARMRTHIAKLHWTRRKTTDRFRVRNYKNKQTNQYNEPMTTISPTTKKKRLFRSFAKKMMIFFIEPGLENNKMWVFAILTCVSWWGGRSFKKIEILNYSIALDNYYSISQFDCSYDFPWQTNLVY